MAEAEKLLRIREAAELLRVSPMTIYRLIREGELQAIKVGWQWRVILPEIPTRRKA